MTDFLLALCVWTLPITLPLVAAMLIRATRPDEPINRPRTRHGVPREYILRASAHRNRF